MALNPLPKQYSPDFASKTLQVPFRPVKKDFKNRFSKGLTHYFIPKGSNLINVAKNKYHPVTLNPTNVTASANRLGRFLECTDDQNADVDDFDFPSGGAFTISWLAAKTTATSLDSIFIGNDAGTSNYIQMTNTDGNIDFFRNGVFVTLNISGVGHDDLVWRSLTVDGTAVVYHANGLTDSDTISSNAVWDIDSVLGGFSSTGFDFNGQFLTLAVHDYALSAQEVIDFHKGPKQALEPQAFVGYSTAVSGAFTLTADSGSYTYTGTDAALKRGLILTADSGTYTYTGTAVELQRGLVLAADSGTYTYTGTAADLLLGSVLDAESGTYVYSGTDATLTFTPSGAFTLTADSGTYTYTGTAVDLQRGLVLTADSGTYTYTGTAANLLTGFNLTADSGTYSYTGTNVDFLLNSVLVGESGTYVYTGTSVILASTGAAIWTVQPDEVTNWSDQANVSTTWAIQT